MSEFAQIEYQPEYDTVVAFHTIHVQAGQCYICKAETDVMSVDPEQSGYGVIPMCQSCVNRLFEVLKQGRFDTLQERVRDLQEEVNKLYRNS